MQNGTVVSVFGEPVEILLSSESSNYTSVAAVQTTPPGGGPPPHRHLGEEEVFTVLDGEFEFFVDGAWVPFAKGEVRTSLRGTYHAFRNSGSTVGKMLFITNGGGLDEYFEAISRLNVPPDMAQVLTISQHYRYEFLPPETT
jgi:mannose-6-phosphate isomerase-like protein (cupin superfamily)